MNDWGTAIAAMVTAVIGLAIISVLVSKNAQTSQVITSFGSSVGTLIGAAVSPVTGGSGGITGAPSASQYGLSG